MKNGKGKQVSLGVRAAGVLKRLHGLRGMSDDEKALFALGIAATPEERWHLVQNHIQLFASFRPSKTRKSASC
jgi:hypothetical protein